MSPIPLVSIIVPAYNAEGYISRCINYILEQTYKNIELIIINDGSSDNTQVLCEEYARNDKRVKVFYKDNGGVSSARNLGLQKCNGEWIAFVDADDYISKDFLECDYSTDADIIQKSYNIIYEETGLSKLHSVSNKTLDDKESIYRFFVRKRTNALWNKIIRRRLISNAVFNEKVRVGEDFLFFLTIVNRINKYSFSGKGIYYYVVHSNSIMASANKDSALIARIMLENIGHIFHILNNKHDRKLRDSIICQSYISALYSYYEFLSVEDKNLLRRYFQDISLSQTPYASAKMKIKLLIKRISIDLWK